MLTGAAWLAPDVELVACTVLREGLAGRGESFAQGVAVDRQVPGPTAGRARPVRLVAVRRDGGTTARGLTRARVGVNVYAASASDADRLAALVSALLAAGVDPAGVLRSYVEVSGPSAVPDDAGTGYRRYFVAELLLRATPLT